MTLQKLYIIIKNYIELYIFGIFGKPRSSGILNGKHFAKKSLS